MPLEQYEASINTMHTLAQMIADQAAASIDNLKMLQDALTAKEDAAKLVEELEVILEAFRDSFAQSDEHATLETIADQLQRLIPYDSCLIYTVDDRADELVPRVVRDPNPDAFWAYRPRKGVGVWGKVAATGVRRKIDDVREDPDFEPVPGVDLEPEAMLVVPMIRKGTIFGVISLSRFERRVFTEHELRILAVFCSHASLSMQVSRMHLAEHAEGCARSRRSASCSAALAHGPGVEETLAAIGRCGLDVLGARSAVLRCHARARRAEPAGPDRASTRRRRRAARRDRPRARGAAWRAARAACSRVPTARCCSSRWSGGADVARASRCSWRRPAPNGTRAWSTRSPTSPRSACATRSRASASAGSSSSTTSSSTLGTELAQAKSRDEIRARGARQERGDLRLGAQHPGPARPVLRRDPGARPGGPAAPASCRSSSPAAADSRRPA